MMFFAQFLTLSARYFPKLAWKPRRSDTQTKGIDDERYAIRFVPRRPHSNWSEVNRAMARRLIAEGRMKPAGAALLPKDL